MVWWIPDHFSSAMKNPSFFKFLIFTESASLTHSLCFGGKLTLPPGSKTGAVGSGLEQGSNVLEAADSHPVTTIRN